MVRSVRLDSELTRSHTLRDKVDQLFTIGSNRRALGERDLYDIDRSREILTVPVVGAGLQATQQLCGFNTLMYYSASIFAALGFQNATAVGLVIASVNFLFTLVALQVGLVSSPRL